VITVLKVSGHERATALPECAGAPASIARPATIPRAFPFPAGTVFTRSFRNRTTRGGPAVEGLLPLRLGEAVSFFDRELPQAGFDVSVRLQKPSGYERFYDVHGFSGRYSVELRAPAPPRARSCSPRARRFSAAASRSSHSYPVRLIPVHGGSHV
jgi:hypothetical protein